MISQNPGQVYKGKNAEEKIILLTINSHYLNKISVYFVIKVKNILIKGVQNENNS